VTTQEVFERHMRHEIDGDLDAVMNDYAPDAIAATPEGVGQGHDFIRDIYAGLLPMLGELELTPSPVFEGDLVYLTFRAAKDGVDQMLGTDTFIIRDDLIQLHTFYSHIPNPGA
jgi:ketosteroid isomerase-like protein